MVVMFEVVFVVFLHHLALLLNQLKQIANQFAGLFVARAKLHQEDQHAAILGRAFGNDALHVLDVGQEERGQVARPGEVHQQGLFGHLRFGRRGVAIALRATHGQEQRAE